MEEGNTDVRPSLPTVLDSVSELFGGSISIVDLLNMDMPFIRSLTKARLANLESKRKARPTEIEDAMRATKQQ